MPFTAIGSKASPNNSRRRSRSGSATLPPCLAWAYAEAARQQRQVREAFDGALAGVDVLATPAVAIPAPRIGQLDAATTGLPETVQAALTRLTCATNFSGHPSLTVPCGRTQLGLPVGVQLIGRYRDEAVLYRAGQALDDAMR